MDRATTVPEKGSRTMTTYLCDRPVNGGASGFCILPDGHRGKCKGDQED